MIHSPQGLSFQGAPCLPAVQPEAIINDNANHEIFNLNDTFGALTKAFKP